MAFTLKQKQNKKKPSSRAVLLRLFVLLYSTINSYFNLHLQQTTINPANLILQFKKQQQIQLHSYTNPRLILYSCKFFFLVLNVLLSIEIVLVNLLLKLKINESALLPPFIITLLLLCSRTINYIIDKHHMFPYTGSVCVLVF